MNTSSKSNICPACKGSSYRTLHAACKDLLHGLPGAWSVVECNSCHLVYTAPQCNKEDILKYYPKNYTPYNLGVGLHEGRVGGFLKQIVMSPYWIRYGNPGWSIAPFGQGRLLDIGCGSGMFLKKMSAQGWKCSGIDISSLAVDQSRKNIPSASLFQSALADFSTEQRFDMIVMSQVLEHLPDPVESLQKCFNLLLPGGKIFIGIPNIGSFEAKVFGKNWMGLEIPRHMVHFSEVVIRQQLAMCGFDIVNIRPAMFASSLSESLILLLPKRIRERILYSPFAHYLYLLAIFPAALSYLMGNRGIIEIVAQRPS